jgi:hypothetical protein
MKYTWTRDYWWFVTIIPIILDSIRLFIISVVFNLESPKSIIKEIPQVIFKKTRTSSFEGVLDLSDTDESTKGLKDDIENKRETTLLLCNPELKKKLTDSPQIQHYLDTLYDKKEQEKVIENFFVIFENENQYKESGNMMNMIFNKSYRTQFFIAIVINALNQLTGINAINFYSKIIFKQLKFVHAETLTIFCGKFLFVSYN